MTASETLWIVGASVRAAAASARRAGFDVWASDLFGDQDLLAVATRFLPIARFGQLRRLSNQLPPCRFMYTGGLENRPRLIDHLMARHYLLGNAAPTLAVVRTPRQWRQVLEAANLPVLEHRRQLPPEARLSDWIEKPIHSSGGIGVRIARGRTARHGHFFQTRVAGELFGATLVAWNHGVQLLGVTKQWPGIAIGTNAEQATARPFQYTGSIGPVALSRRRRDFLQTAADALVAASGLRGLFGIDWIDDGNSCWLLEINPRYPASAEVLELAGSSSVVGRHVAACLGGNTLNLGAWREPTELAAKAICYAPTDVNGAEIEQWTNKVQREFSVRMADVPPVDSQIPTGAPLISLLANGTDVTELEHRLTRAVSSLREAIRQAAKCG